jgi:hypothetical protein
MRFLSQSCEIVKQSYRIVIKVIGYQTKSIRLGGICQAMLSNRYNRNPGRVGSLPFDLSAWADSGVTLFIYKYSLA